MAASALSAATPRWQIFRPAPSRFYYSHLWSETYDRELDDIFAVQDDDIAQSVVKELRAALLHGDPRWQSFLQRLGLA